MGLLDNVKGMLSQYMPGNSPTGNVSDHFDQVAQSVDPATLAHGISAALHSDQAPPVADVVSQLFSSATADQKAGMLNALLASATPELRAKVAGLIPGTGAGSALTAPQAAAVSPTVVASIASQAHAAGGNVIDQMSAFYAQHPTLVKALGSAAMIVAMRKIAERKAGG